MRMRRCPAIRVPGPPRRAVLFAMAGLLLAPAAAHAEQYYDLRPGFGTIEFSVRHLGLFTSQGQFRRFDASLIIDVARPERTRIAVDVDAASVDMAWQDAAEMLRSPEFFDVQRYPTVRFTSTAVTAVTPDHYRIAGVVEMRGVKQPVTLDATLTDRPTPTPNGAPQIADFVVTGRLQRSAFGMVADQGFISDDVNLAIRARIYLSAAPHAG